jgi:hypothetical protein
LTLPTCTRCGKQVDPNRAGGAWTKIEAWEQRRAQGGTNHAALRRPLGVYLCNGCMKLLQAGIATEQTSMLP